MYFRGKNKWIILLVLALAVSLVSCGEEKESAEEGAQITAVPTQTPTPKPELVASSVELPYGNYEGPHPDNLVDVRAIRGSYTLPEFEDEPGFETVESTVLIAKEEMSILTEMEENVAVAGILPEGGAFSILSEEEDGWVYVESGKTRGFLKDPSYDNMAAVDYAKEPELTFAEPMLQPRENKAFFYKWLTAQQNPAPAIPAIAKEKSLPILEEQDASARVIGELPQGGTAYVLEVVNDEWLYVESGYVRGFLQAAEVLVGEAAEEYMSQNAGTGPVLAVAQIPFSENKAAYYTVTSIDPGRSAHEQGGEFTQIIGLDRTNELEIPETFSGRRVGWMFSCTPDYGIRNWMFDMAKIHQMWRNYGSVYKDNIARIDDLYLIACTEMYGDPGDYVTFYLDDGTPLHCIIADQKSSKDEHYTSYGHIHGTEIDVIEAETLYSINPGHEGCAPSWGGHRVCSCVNHGPFQPY